MNRETSKTAEPSMNERNGWTGEGLKGPIDIGSQRIVVYRKRGIELRTETCQR
jgi:hypothetical protein